MDPIVSGAILQQQQQIAMQVQASVLQKTQDVQKQLGEAIVGLIQDAVVPMPGKALGSGTTFDIYA